MLLAIDSGNTNTLFAVHDGDSWRAQWRSATDSSRTADEYVVWLAQLLELRDLKLSDLSDCIISSVVPQSLFHLRNLARRYIEVEPLVVGEDGLDIGVPVRLDRPGEVGADRLVNALGALAEFTPPLLIVDSGTATTFDVVSADGAFEGGVISPGINLSMQALHDAAAKLPRIAIRRPEQVIGRDTVAAMQSGIFWGYVNLIDGLIEQIVAEFGQPMTVVGTGGVVSLFEGASKQIAHFDPDLTIRGILEIWRRHKDRAA
ncbi:MAG: type III pantothenate kinase [Maricaulaceae bacterium]|jgi:type III pantothenate kinase